MSKPVVIGKVKGDYYLSESGTIVTWIAVFIVPLVYGLFFWWLWPFVCERFLPDIPVVYSRIGLWETYKTLLLALLCGAFIRLCVRGFSPTVHRKLTGEEINKD